MSKWAYLRFTRITVGGGFMTSGASSGCCGRLRALTADMTVAYGSEFSYTAQEI